ncbi:serine/threonine protein kinase [Okeania hirsuta]|uniref:non-specific serine/threonine protein kinase n=2 Tax=Microcoleaceae TaxID=1892252 RepID=A0A3N6PLP8_9CYAN|nr:protein kinase [Okeania sp. SIO2B9]RQH57484.1 serine/threonine protein kinase [Okeania hirsuta]
MNMTTCTNCGHNNTIASRFCSNCGAFLEEIKPFQTASTELKPGSKLRNRYIIIRQIGQGGFGKTYLAEDTGRFKQAVVLKQLTPGNQGTEFIQKAEELFHREAMILHQINHPQIPRFWEFIRENKCLFLVQDFIEGQTYESLLSQRRRQGKFFSEVEIIDFIRQILPVLNYLHSRGIIHRDIAPDNIICRAEDGLPILIDLGGVKQIAAEVSHKADSSENVVYSGTKLGKFGYAPDEQMRLGIVAPHSDLYALGVTCLVLMTGKLPSELINTKTMQWQWSKELKLSPKFDGILNRMLAFIPGDRFQSAEEILVQLQPPEPEIIALTQISKTESKNQKIETKTAIASIPKLGNIIHSSNDVPAEIIGWNWGAFFLPGLWCLTNHVWIGLIAWIDLSFVTLGMGWLLTGIILGLKGNEWAWKSRKWKNVAEFRKHQRIWSIISLLLISSAVIIGILVILFLFVIAAFIAG